MKGKLTLKLCFWTFLFPFITSFGNPLHSGASAPGSYSVSYLSSGEFIINDTITNLPDTSYYQISDCNDTVLVCLDIPLSEINNYQIFQNGLAYASGISACNVDTIEYYDYSTLEGQGNAGPYVLQSWIVNGVIRTAPFNTIAELVDSMNFWDPTGNWTDLGSPNRIVGGDDANTYSESMVIWVPSIGSPDIIDLRDSIDVKGTSVSVTQGFHRFVINEPVTACSDTFSVWVRCIEPKTLTLSVNVGETAESCLDFSTLSTSVDTVENICPVNMDPAASISLVNGDSCLSYTGLTVGIDTACLRFCDDNQLCDTTTFIIKVRNIQGFTEQNLTIASQSRDTVCLDPGVFAGSIDTIYNYCPGSSGTYATVEIDTANYCVYLEGIAHRGRDTACIVICDYPDCDTLQLNIEVRRVGPAFVFDTLTVGESGQFCNFDTTNLVAALLLIDNFCTGSSGEFVEFTLDNTSLCADFTAIDVGTDTACVLLRDIFGNPDTTYLIVTAQLPVTEVIVDTIRQGLTVDYCIDTTELPGIIQDTIYFCQPFNGNAVGLQVDESSFCVEVEGLNPGNDTICLVVCDDLAICDTTLIYVTVDTTGIGSLMPVAVADLDSTTRNTPVTIDVLANDFIPNDFWTQFFIIPVDSGGIGPNHGTVVLDASVGTIDYIPEQGFCGDFDFIEYVVCNASGCDTAIVTVIVYCPPGSTSDTLRVLNGFSPNNDNDNETFVIEGIDNFPNHILYVYNRWGNLVLERTNYRNDWRGTWEGVDLPDGVYFYLLDTGEGESLTGYVLLRR